MALSPYGEMITNVSATLAPLLDAMDRGEESRRKNALAVALVLRSHLEGLINVLIDLPRAMEASPDLDLGELVTGLQAAGLPVITMGFDEDDA